MKQVAKEALTGNKSDYEKMKAIAKAYITKRECSVQEAVYLIMPELWLCKIFPRVIFLNSNLPEKRFRIFKKKAKIDELPDDSTDIFQRNILDRYLDRPNENFKNGEYKIIDQLCFAEFLSPYYIDAKQSEIFENDSQPVVLNDELMNSNHQESIFPKIVPLMSSKEKLKCRKVKEVLRYHQPSPHKIVEQYAHHLLFAFYPFRHEEEPKCTGTGAYFAKLQEPAVLNIINRNKSVMEPYSDMVEQALSSLHSELVNPDLFGQQENDDVQAELTDNNLLDDIENQSDDEAVFLDDISNLPAYTTPTLMPDCELNAVIRSLNHKQRTLFNIVHSWARQYVRSRSALSLQNLEPLYIFLTGNAGCGKSFLMEVLYQSLTKTLSYGNVSVDKPKVLLIAPIGAAAVNIDGTTIHTALNIPIGSFGKNVPPMGDKMKSSLRNKLSDLKVIIVDEISMVSNDLLFYVHLRLNEIFGSVNNEPFAGITVITVGDFFQLPPVG